MFNKIEKENKRIEKLKIKEAKRKEKEEIKRLYKGLRFELSLTECIAFLSLFIWLLYAFYMMVTS